jgi:hypothetical protein
MDHGTDRNRKRWESMTPEQRAAVESIRARRQAAEYREREAKSRRKE